MNKELIPNAAPYGGGHRAGPRREGATLLLLRSYSFRLILAASVLFLTNLLAGPLASERGFHALLLAGFQIKGVAFNLFDNVFLLHFALEAAQGIFKRFTLLQSNFRQTDTPPDPSGRTE